MLNIVFVCNKFSPAHVYTIDSYSFVFKKAGYRIFLMKDFITDGLNLSSMGIPLFSVKEAKKEDL